MAHPNQGELETMSVRRQIRVMGAERADDLISTMIDDHEQAPRRQPPGASRAGNYPTATPTRPAVGAAATPNIALSPPTASTRAPGQPESDNPFTSLVSRIWRSNKISEDVVVPPASLAIKQTHWKSTVTASKCASPNCRRLFNTRRIKRRNCAMCGNVFCQNCTNYNRRLSTNAQPDPLGQFYSVCQACFNFNNAFGGFRDNIRAFRSIRQQHIDLVENSEAMQDKFCLCSRRTTDSKRVAMKVEIDRLVEGYQANLSKLKGFVSEMVVPDWQKSASWVPTKNALACLNCGEKFGVVKRKLHCRIGGQVFCSKCASDELILYVDDATGKVNWALNGKEGGPTEVPQRFRLLIICKSCSTELEAMIAAAHTAPPPSTFLDSLHSLHSQLSGLQEKIAKNLPQYKQLVEAMDGEDSSPNRVNAKQPMGVLIKAHMDLSDAFSSLAVESQKLKQLKPKSHTQEKLLRNVMVGTYRFYSDNMFSFRNLKDHLAELVPMETVQMIQTTLSQRTLERIHMVIQQLTLEALKLEHRHQFDNSFFTPIIAISKWMDVEFKEFVEKQGESWQDHNKIIMQFIEDELKNKRHRIKLDRDALQLYPTRVVHYLVVSHCSNIIHECYRELQAKTIDRDFKEVKKSLHTACTKLDGVLVSLNSIV